MKIELLAHCATDLAVVNAARVSHASESTYLEKGDIALIGYLMRNRHGSPFEHGYFRFRVDAPIFVLREWQRHRIGHSYNEVSGRYTTMPDRRWVPRPGELREQVGKTGAYTYAPVVDEETLNEALVTIDLAYIDATQAYYKLLELGVAKEQARAVLPIGTYSQMIWSCNPRSLMHFLSLRTHETAQAEIRELALKAEALFADVMPYTHTAFIENDRVAP